MRLAQSNHKWYQGLFDEAIQFARQAIEVAEGIQYDFGINEGNLLLAKCYLARGNNAKTRGFIPKIENLQSVSQKDEFMLEQAIILAREKEFSKADDYFSNSIEQFRELGHEYDMEIALIRRSVYLSNNDN